MTFSLYWDFYTQHIENYTQDVFLVNTKQHSSLFFSGCKLQLLSASVSDQHTAIQQTIIFNVVLYFAKYLNIQGELIESECIY